VLNGIAQLVPSALRARASAWLIKERS
jgi:hypothetical protein